MKVLKTYNFEDFSFIQGALGIILFEEDWMHSKEPILESVRTHKQTEYEII